MPRARYQCGSLTLRKREKGPKAWEFRYYESTERGPRLRKTCTVGSVEKYKTKAAAQKAVEALLLTLNSETPQQRMAVVTFGAICDRYMQEEMPERYSTAKSYRSNIVNHLKPRWGDYLMDRIRPMEVEDWLKNLPMAQVEGSYSGCYALDVRVCSPLGARQRAEEPHRIGSRERRHEAPAASHDPDCGRV